MTPRPGAERGMALIEALMASAVLGIGLLGTLQLTLKTLRQANENRQHTVAQGLAQEAMDCLHVRSGGCPVRTDIQVQGVRYTRLTQSTPRDGGLIIDLQVSVEWSVSGTPAGPTAEMTANHHGQKRLLWHSSVSGIPLWVGVSSR